jgi:hypothetical protein
MSRQRCVLGAILDEADPTTVLQNFTALAEVSTSVVTTNIPQEQLPDLVDMAWKAKDLPVVSLQLVPPLIVPAEPDFDAIAEHLDRAIEASRIASDGQDAAAEPVDQTEPDATAEPAADSTGDPAADGISESAGEPATTVDLSSVCSYE